MLQKMVTEAVIHDFYGLQKLAGEKTIYGCALVTDSDFGSVFMSMNTVREAGDPTSYDWDIYSWEYTSDQLNNSKLPGVSKELWRLLDRSGDSLQDTVLPVFVQALKHLQQDLVYIPQTMHHDNHLSSLSFQRQVSQYWHVFPYRVE